jgi:hypothetical protein
MKPGLALALAIAAGTIGLARDGSGDEAAARTSSLSWVRLPGAEGCVATQLLARAVEQRLGRTVFVSAAQADVSVEGRIEPGRAKKGFQAIITLRDAKGGVLGTRELARAEPSCDAMTEPLALVIAVMIDPDAALGPKPAPTASPPDTPASPPAPPAEREIVVQKELVFVPVPVPAKIRAPWLFEGSSAFVTALGLQPKLGLGVGVNAILEPPHFLPVEAFGAIFFDSSAPGDRGSYVTLNVAYVGSGLCPLRWRARVLHLFACAESHLGLTRARAGGFESSSSEAFRPLLDGALSGRATVRLVGPLALRAGLSGVVPLLRYRYTYERDDGSRGTAFLASPVAAVLDVGLGLALP